MNNNPTSVGIGFCPNRSRSLDPPPHINPTLTFHHKTGRERICANFIFIGEKINDLI